MKGNGIVKTCMYKCCEYGTATEKKDEMSLSNGIPRYKRRRHRKQDCAG